MAISRTDSGGSASKVSLEKSLATIEAQLKAAQAAYDRAVSNKESSTIVTKAKKALDNAKKAYSLSQPLRNDLAAAEDKKAYALSPAGIRAANAAYDLANKKITPTESTDTGTDTTTTIDPNDLTDTPPPTGGKASTPTGGKGLTSSGTSKTSVSKATVISKPTAQFDPNKSPGKAWIWDGKKWVKPPLPSKGKVYNWNDETGWQLKPVEEQVNVNFADLTAEEQAAVGSIGEQGDVFGQKRFVSRNPRYDDAGKLLGYDVVYSDGSTSFEKDVAELIPESISDVDSVYIASDGTRFTDQAAYAAYETNLTTVRLAKEAIAAEDLSKRTSAYDLLYNEFAQYGLGDLVTPLKEFIMAGISPSEFTLRLRETAPYRERFKANEGRIKAGLAAISEAEYIGLEDQYQNVMRNYGLPESYYAKGQYGTQVGFQKFIENDVSATELEDRIMTAQERVLNSNPEVLASLKAFYPGINNGDILAYTLDPKNALTEIKRKVTAAEIGGAAIQAGIKTDLERAQELQAAGIDKAAAQQGFQTVAEVAPRGGQLAAMYGESPYTQQTAEQEVFGLAGSVEATKQRRKLAGLEQASFAGKSGTAQGALGRERAGNF
jgi:hypothetical protein